MKNLKRYWRMVVRSKTNLFAAALAGFSALQLAMPTFAEQMNPGEFAGVGVFIAVAIAYLRSITTAPLSEKAEQ